MLEKLNRFSIFAPHLARDVAQLVARYVRDVEVGSSSLLIPTNENGLVN
jgi:hypothetical protein